MKRTHLILAASSGLSAQMLFAQPALPSLTRAFTLPQSTETVYEAADNETSDMKVFYYIPKRTVFEKIQGQSVFSFLLRRDLSSSVEFRLALAPSETISQNYDKVLGNLAALAQVPLERVKLMSMPLFTAKTKVFDGLDELKPMIVPPDNVPATGSLPFYFELNKDGTRWFRKALVERSLPLGALEAEVRFYDEFDGKTVPKPIKIPLSLDAVPLCAISASSCLFKW